jgi:FMN reductase
MSSLSHPARHDVVVLVGNPAAGSRTSTVAQLVGAGLSNRTGSRPAVVELRDVGPALFDPEDQRVRAAQETVTVAEVLVVATPVYKAGYTGLLKLFLDTLSSTALEGTVVVPVVVSASAAHGALTDVQLRVVLQALGAVLSTPSLVIEEHHLDHLPQYVDAWHQRFAPTVRALTDSLVNEAVGAR